MTFKKGHKQFNTGRTHFKKGYTPWNKIQGYNIRKTRFYNILKGMKTRCNNLNSTCYYKYGAKGIKICKRWDNFLNFKEDMYKDYLAHVEEFGEKNTTIDRIDNNKGYSKENCRWTTWKIQRINQKR